MWYTKRILEETGATFPPHTQSCVGSLRMGEVAQRVDCWPTAEKVPGSVLSTVGTGHGSPIMEDQELKAILGYLVNSEAAWDT